jgi:glucose/arabinose dehydrogenase
MFENRTNFLGKTIRIDVDTRTGNLEYGIPADNPFLNDTDATPELYALGFRNPWKASMDPGDRTTGSHASNTVITISDEMTTNKSQ